MRGLEGRAVLVTGGGSGIGRRAAERLAVEGAAVAILDADAERATRVASAVAGTGARALALPCDVREEKAVVQAIAQVAAEIGPPAGLVTSAGVFLPPDLQPLGDVELETFENVLSVNLTGTFLCLKHALPHLVEQGGAVVTIASTAGLRGHGQGSAYTASKGGVIALTRIVALQYGPRGVRANCVCPGATAGEGMGAAFADPELAGSYSKGVPLRRVGEGDELASTIAFLLSEDASYLTGQIIAVDGGATIR